MVTKEQIINETPEKREQRLEWLRKYNRNNAQKINKKNIENHKNNLNYNIKRSKIYECECGGKTCISNKSHHNHTLMHLKCVVENTSTPIISF